MKTRIAALTLIAVLALTGCGEDTSSGATESQRIAASETSEPLVAETPSPTAGADLGEAESPEAQEVFLEFVRGRQATFVSQIPNATDQQLLDAAHDACNRIREGESVDKMSVIKDEQPSEVGGYFYDSNAIIAGAQMHLCQDTLG